MKNHREILPCRGCPVESDCFVANLWPRKALPVSVPLPNFGVVRSHFAEFEYDGSKYLRRRSGMVLVCGNWLGQLWCVEDGIGMRDGDPVFVSMKTNGVPTCMTAPELRVLSDMVTTRVAEQVLAC